ncbi:MAG: FkbM family methyltransferase [Phycisphaerales bacterium]|nr:MAG: FkbM family methyltransferase [Phycisphaerales bacterium]
MNKCTRRALRALRLYDAVVDLKHWLTGTEAEYVKFYSQFVNPGDLCFDVGANVGRRTKVLLRLNAKVVAVEPQERCMKKLQRKLGDNDSVILVQRAVGEKPGWADIRLCDSHSLSSLSTDWIERVQSSGRYSECTWDTSITIEITTLDQLISDCGRPTFVKLDVEGYEYEALKGLSEPVKVICFEFTPEFIESTRKCIDHLSRIGSVHFNYCLENDQTSLKLSKWATVAAMHEVLDSVSSQKLAGDVYARFQI